MRCAAAVGFPHWSTDAHEFMPGESCERHASLALRDRYTLVLPQATVPCVRTLLLILKCAQMCILMFLLRSYYEYAQCYLYTSIYCSFSFVLILIYPARPHAPSPRCPYDVSAPVRASVQSQHNIGSPLPQPKAPRLL